MSELITLGGCIAVIIIVIIAAITITIFRIGIVAIVGKMYSHKHKNTTGEQDG